MPNKVEVKADPRSHTVSPSEMETGHYGIIMHDEEVGYLDYVVLRSPSCLVVLSDGTWFELKYADLRFRVLPIVPGKQIIITVE